MSDSTSEDESDAAVVVALEALPSKQSKSTSFVRASKGETYLHASARPVKTSNNHFSSKLAEPFTKESFQAALATDPNPNQAYQLLLPLYAARYPLWQLQLQEGFTLLFYGVGSKRELLNDFAQSCLAKHADTIVINGYSTSVGIPELLTALESHFKMPNDRPPLFIGVDRNENRALTVIEFLDKNKRAEVYLLIHSLDAANWKMAKAVNILAILAAHPRIHLLASVDHVRSMLSFNTHTTSAIPHSTYETPSKHVRGFSFLHHHVPTFQNFTKEVLASDLLSNLFSDDVFASEKQNKVDVSSSSRVNGIISTYASFSKHHNDLLRLLGNEQLAKYENLEADQEPANEQIAQSNHAPTPCVAVGMTWLQQQAQEAMITLSGRSGLNNMFAYALEQQIIATSKEAPAEIAEEDPETEWIWIRLARRPLTTLMGLMNDDAPDE